MRPDLKKIRYLRHPYLIIRTIFLPLEKKNSIKLSKRLDEYTLHSKTLEASLTLLTTTTEAKVMDYVAEIRDSEFLRTIQSHDNMSIPMGVSTDARILLYTITRASSPKTVVETGVASGVSSSFILKALNKNGQGELYSIDLHYREGIAVPTDRQLGWLVPDNLRSNWHLVLGDSIKVLPKLLKKLKTIDIFIHDSRHMYKTMMFEYKTAWKHIKIGGLLVSDDVKCNDAFLDFADSVNGKPLIIDRMGVLQKYN